MTMKRVLKLTSSGSCLAIGFLVTCIEETEKRGSAKMTCTIVQGVANAIRKERQEEIKSFTVQAQRMLGLKSECQLLAFFALTLPCLAAIARFYQEPGE